MKTLVLLGAGGFAQTIADLARQSRQYGDIFFLDDNATALNAQGPCADYIKYPSSTTDIYPAFGNNEIRLRWVTKLLQEHRHVPSFIHPTAYVSPTAWIGPAVAILPHAVVNTNCRIERGCILNCSCVIDHDCIAEEGVHIGVGALVKAANRLPSKLKLEAGQVVANGTYPL